MNYKRRDFIKITGLTAAGSLIVAAFFQSCSGVRLSDNAGSYLNHLKVTRETG